MDFVTVSMKSPKKDVVEVYPKFLVGRKNDLMIRGGDFYAVWNEKEKRWATDQDTVIKMIDSELEKEAKELRQKTDHQIVVKLMRDSESGSIDKWRHYVQKQQEDNWVSLDGKIIFSNHVAKREDYSSHHLDYPLVEGDHSSFDRLMSVLYSPEERMKIEWAIGSIVAGDSVKIQKFIVLIGDAGTGKSTVLKIIRMLFNGYTATIDAKAIGSPLAAFALESLKKNPLVAIQDDADLSTIKDNTRLNSLVSHEFMSVNEKFKSPYEHAYRCFIFLGSNEDVQITDSRSGLQRRLIDVRPTGKTVPPDEYIELMDKIPFELSGIAYHCMQVYKANKHAYDKYKPTQSMRNTNHFYNFLEEQYSLFENGVSLKDAWSKYNSYCDEGGITYRLNKMELKREMTAYFERFVPEYHAENGVHVYNWFDKIKPSKFGKESSEVSVMGSKDDSWLKLDCTASRFDMEFADCPAQYAKEDGSPKLRWSDVKTTLAEIDTSKLHWLKLPETIIKVDFDKKDKDGNKSLEENIKAASSFPKTYAEVSKSGCGIHLYYIYDGDVAELSRVYDENIEVKVSTGNNSHRRIFTKCNNLPIATISCGLPLKGWKPEKDIEIPCTVAGLKTTIEKCLAKQVHADTTSNVDWIYKVLEQAYNSGLQYDLEDEFKERVRKFAEGSSHQSERCLKKFQDMKFKSKDYEKKGEEELLDQDYILRDQEIRRAMQLDMCYNYDFEPEMDVLKRVYETLEHYYTCYKAFGRKYDVSDMRQELLEFAMNAIESDPKECVDFIGSFKFASDGDDFLEINHEQSDYSDDSPIIFFDFEVFPNLVLLCWKYAGKNEPVHKVFNPTPQDIGIIFGIGQDKKPKAIGFNNKEYDNHIAYAIWMGKTTYEVFMLSQAIINNEKSAKYREAKNLSYTDIFDYSPEKISLKKWEIRLKIHHQELGLKWDEPVDEKWWDLVAEYCCNDVIATEAVFNETQSYFKGRLILCDLANIIMGPGSTPNDSTNELTTKLIVGNEKNPQRYFIYPDLSKEFPGYEYDPRGIDKSRYISPDVIISGKSIYKGYDPGEGGFVWAQHGAHGMTESWDSSSHHPSSLNAENGFGKFTPNFKMLLELRLMVKHKEYDKLRQLYNGALAKYLESDEDAKALSFALKIAINSVYGLTAARFPNRLRDPRNVDNWVAKRGALFMIDLMLNVRAMGYKVIHCKTDSIKIVNPDDKVRNYIRDFGKQYGYTFELEHRFDRICLVNDAVYICKYADDDCNDPEERGKWDATGKQFQVPYVFKTLLSHEPIEFDDMCEMRSSSTALYLDLNENLPEGEHDYQFVGKTGLFCPMKPGTGGGRLLREKNGKYSSAESAKDYRWLEAEIVEHLNKQEDIDKSYYISQVDKAVETISKFCDFEQFVSDAPFTNFEDFMNVPEGIDEEIPWN